MLERTLSYFKLSCPYLNDDDDRPICCWGPKWTWFCHASLRRCRVFLWFTKCSGILWCYYFLNCLIHLHCFAQVKRFFEWFALFTLNLIILHYSSFLRGLAVVQVRRKWSTGEHKFPHTATHFVNRSEDRVWTLFNGCLLRCGGDLPVSRVLFPTVIRRPCFLLLPVSALHLITLSRSVFVDRWFDRSRIWTVSSYSRSNDRIRNVNRYVQIFPSHQCFQAQPERPSSFVKGSNRTGTRDH